MLAWRQYDDKTAINVQSIYERVGLHASSSIRFFPSATELGHVLGKIESIQALDEVARCSSLIWSFRLITCDSTTRCLD